MSSNATAGGAGGAGAVGDTGAVGPISMSPDEVRVYRLDIALLCVLAAFVLVFLPRTIGRISSAAGWGRGVILRSATPSDPMVQRVQPGDKLYPVNTILSFGDGTSDNSHTLADHDAYPGPGKKWASVPSGRGNTNPPAHVRSFATVFHPISKIFTYPLGPQQSTGKLLLTLAYIGTILGNAFYNNSPILGPNRLALISVSQLPIVFALGTKNNIIGMVLGLGYEKLNFLHRLVGTMSFVMANVHATAYIFRFTITGEFGEFATPLVQHGMWALYGFTILFFGSGSGIRNGSYGLFLLLHVVGGGLFLIGLWLHQPIAMKYIGLALGIYGIDHLLRIVKTRVTTARLTTVPELGLTRVELPRVGAGWRAGQHVRLRVLTGALGPLGWTVAHPFTIASASESDGKGMVLMCKKAGSWTKRLYNAAGQTGTGGYGAESGYGVQAVREMKVIVEGPYGGLGNTVMSSYSSVLLVAGGSGLTFALGVAEELTQDIIAGKSAVKFIEIVWSMQDRGSLAPMLPAFSNLLYSVANVPGVILRITTHYTRAEKPVLDGGKASSSSLDAHLATLAPNLTLQPGRPPLQHIANNVARLTANVSGARGLAVGVCGPASLAHETTKVVRAVDADLRSACGGIEIHQEVFGW